MCAFSNSVMYCTRFPLICHEYSALVTVYLFTILPYILRSNVLVRWENVHYQRAELRQHALVSRREKTSSCDWSGCLCCYSKTAQWSSERVQVQYQRNRS